MLHGAWGHVPRRLTHNVDLVLAYATQLHRLAQDDEAESLLRSALKKNLDDRLVDLYGRLQSNVRQQLATAEGWLHDHERNPALLLALGRLAMRNSLWGKAREYFEASIGATPSVEAYQLLGSLAEQLNDNALMTYCYRKGMLLATGAQAALVASYAPDTTETAGAEPASRPRQSFAGSSHTRRNALLQPAPAGNNFSAYAPPLPCRVRRRQIQTHLKTSGRAVSRAR